MKTLLASLLLAASFGASSASDIETHPEPCTVRAWVRAEDLSPDHISRGELRIKVPRAECANQIASVALRLQLDEFGEFKYLKGGAIIPEVQPSNQSTPSEYADWMGSDVVYDYQAHDDGLSDPALWAVKAEERRAWTTEATLIENNPDLSQPIVTAFTVAVPRVNYPPVVENSRRYLRGPVSKHSFSDLGYRYIAVVTFIDGRTEDVPAGRTTFVPSSQTNPQQMPRTWNVTFEDSDCRRDTSPTMKKRDEDLEKCLPEVHRSAFAAEITLDEGTVAQKGRSLKGRVTVRRTKDGSTTMSDLSVKLVTSSRDHWVQAAAAAGGDVEFYNATSGLCNPSSVSRELCAESERFAHVFYENDDDGKVRPVRLYSVTTSTTNKTITPAHSHLDFEIQVPHDWPTDFSSYYSSNENQINFYLSVLYSQDVAECIRPGLVSEDEMETADDAAKTEEGLWDPYTRVGKPISTSRQQRQMRLQATVPITVVRGGPVPARPIVHYLTPGALAPVLRSGAHLEMPASFPPAQPVFTVEALANTSARLMQPGSTDPYQKHQQFMNITRLRRDYPDPTRNYQKGNYAGVLWKKKVVAEERGILPLRTEGVDGGEDQLPFSFAP
ncbi:hypothetical protein MVEN_00974100 [Mycena venus]|uniref:Uncharacterized protein n=1 Tax=Mycena venus TaxID=2733690 RepID=A0A8H7D2K2_9AGAR|nr:hypothetical protein MVEN_00974100 [Mycena venus]